VLQRRHHRTYNPKHVPIAALQFTTSPVIRSPDSPSTHSSLFPEFKTRSTSQEQPTGNESVRSAKKKRSPTRPSHRASNAFSDHRWAPVYPPNVPNLLHATVLRVTRRQFRGSSGGGRPGDFFRRVKPNKVWPLIYRGPSEPIPTTTTWTTAIVTQWWPGRPRRNAQNCRCVSISLPCRRLSPSRRRCSSDGVGISSGDRAVGRPARRWSKWHRGQWLQRARLELVATAAAAAARNNASGPRRSRMDNGTLRRTIARHLCRRPAPGIVARNPATFVDPPLTSPMVCGSNKGSIELYCSELRNDVILIVARFPFA